MTSAWVDPAPVTVRVPAKVNLELAVGPKRKDGFHRIATVFQAVSLYDDVTVEPATDWDLVVEGPFQDLVPDDHTNLAWRAARLLADTYDVDEPIAITIRKDIPVAGGMAGGSADAAATLVACDALWDLGLGRDVLEHHAATLGSDVPFLIGGGTAVGTGRGELLAPALAHGTFHWVFALSAVGLSAKEVYAECDRLRGTTDVPAPTPRVELLAALRAGDAAEVAALLDNDLQQAAFSLRPDLAVVRDEGVRLGALGGVVSGSGPTVAFLVADQEAGIDLAVSLTASGLASDVRRASGPVHGAHVLPQGRVD